jgi:tetratricopeptide (TPR) repeat protein
LNTTRLTEAEKAYVEALEIKKKLVKTNPASYLPDLAQTFNNMAYFYNYTKRSEKAKKAYFKALGIYQTG